METKIYIVTHNFARPNTITSVKPYTIREEFGTYFLIDNNIKLEKIAHKNPTLNNELGLASFYYEGDLALIDLVITAKEHQISQIKAILKRQYVGLREYEKRMEGLYDDIIRLKIKKEKGDFDIGYGNN